MIISYVPLSYIHRWSIAVITVCSGVLLLGSIAVRGVYLLGSIYSIYSISYSQPLLLC